MKYKKYAVTVGVEDQDAGLFDTSKFENQTRSRFEGTAFKIIRFNTESDPEEDLGGPTEMQWAAGNDPSDGSLDAFEWTCKEIAELTGKAIDACNEDEPPEVLMCHLRKILKRSGGRGHDGLLIEANQQQEFKAAIERAIKNIKPGVHMLLGELFYNQFLPTYTGSVQPLWSDFTTSLNRLATSSEEPLFWVHEGLNDEFTLNSQFLRLRTGEDDEPFD